MMSNVFMICLLVIRRSVRGKAVVRSAKAAGKTLPKRDGDEADGFFDARMLCGLRNFVGAGCES